MAESDEGAAAANGSQRRESTRNNADPMSDLQRLSRTGDSLYELLDIPKTSTNQEIKKKYRRLALKYHPDKNPNNPEAEDMFRKINHAQGVLTDDKKRDIYDKYGSFGLHIAERFGDEIVDYVMCFQSKWFQCLFWSCCILTGCYGCCCCFCCFCMCCGKCAPKMPEDEEVPDVAEFEGDDEEHHEGNGDVVTEEPGKSKTRKADSSPKPPGGAMPVFAMPPPEASDQGAIPLGAPTSSEPPTEGTPLKPKGDESTGGNYDSTGASPTKS